MSKPSLDDLVKWWDGLLGARRQYDNIRRQLDFIQDGNKVEDMVDDLIADRARLQAALEVATETLESYGGVTPPPRPYPSWNDGAREALAKIKQIMEGK